MQTVLPHVSCVGKRGVCRVPCGGLSEHYPPSTPGKRFDLHPHFIVKTPGLQGLASIMAVGPCLMAWQVRPTADVHLVYRLGPAFQLLPHCPCYLSYFRDPRNLIHARLHGNQLRRRGVQGQRPRGHPIQVFNRPALLE